MPASPEPAGLTVIRRLHRMVRQGYRPWLGYDADSGEDRSILLHTRGGTATILPDGTVTFTGAASLPTIPGSDAEAFDAAFPPNRPNKRNLVRRLYEIGL